MGKHVKVIPKKPLTAKELRKGFTFLNRTFFGNRIPSTVKLGFMTNCGYIQNNRWHNVDAFFDGDEFQIMIDQHIAYSYQNTTIALLHEMIHADLQLRGYKDYPGEQHGMTFQGELVRLIQEGAFDALL